MTVVAITGASGLIGSALTRSLRDRGDRVIRFVRRETRSADERRWDPATGLLDPASLADIDTVVNLAGAGIGDRRWSTEHKRAILRSRVDATRAVVGAIEGSGRGIRLVNGSAVGIYGDRGDEILTETSDPGTGFLSEVVRAWEGSAQPLLDRGGSVAFARTGIVASPSGGAFAPLIRLTKFGLGGPIGLGRPYWPLISLADEVSALTFLIDRPELTGPVNLTGPAPARQRDIARALGTAMGRPAFLPAPPLAVRIVVGEFAGEITASQRALPTRLTEAGFAHQHPTLAEIVRSATADAITSA